MTLSPIVSGGAFVWGEDMGERLMTGGVIGALIAALLSVLIIAANGVTMVSALMIVIILGAVGCAAGILVAARRR